MSEGNNRDDNPLKPQTNLVSGVLGVSGKAKEPLRQSFEALWKVADVARFLSVSTSWVYKEAEAGRLPCVRLGANLRFQPPAIRLYLERLSFSKVIPFGRGV